MPQRCRQLERSKVVLRLCLIKALAPAHLYAFCAALIAFIGSSVSSCAADMVWGVNGHPFTAYPGVDLATQVRLLDELGAKAYRINVSSAQQFGPLSQLVQVAGARGVQIVPVLTPPVSLKDASEAELYRMSRAFGFEAARHLKGLVPTWELGNELESFAIITACEIQDDGHQYNCNWGPAGGTTSNEYFTPRWRKVSSVLKGLSDGVAAGDPLAKRAIGAAGFGHWGMFSRLTADGISWDISVWHIYGEDPEPPLKVLASFGKPIWITEVNDPILKGNFDEKTQADGLDKMLKLILKHSDKYKVEGVFVYELLDEPYWGDVSEAHYGMWRLVRSPQNGWKLGGEKLSARTFRNFTKP